VHPPALSHAVTLFLVITDTRGRFSAVNVAVARRIAGLGGLNWHARPVSILGYGSEDGWEHKKGLAAARPVSGK
jgi:hypothetical protein